jgi:hypothetical protein
MKHLRSYLMGLGLTLLAASAVARAPGSDCAMDGSAKNAYRIWGGIGSSTTSAGTTSRFLCPFTAQSGALSSVTIDAYNKGDANGQVSCIVAGYTKVLTGWWSETRWLCGNAGGCLSSSFPGDMANTLTWSNPIGSHGNLSTSQAECRATNNAAKSMVMAYRYSPF